MGDVLEFVQKTAAEERGFSNGHKFRTNAPEDMAVAFYEACWEDAAEAARNDPKNTDNLARLCVQTETLAMQFLSAGIEDMSTRTDGTENTKTQETASALQKLVEARFPNGSQLKQQLTQKR